MPRMTEEEADALDELVTKNPPRVDPAKARHVARMVALDDFSAEYLLSVSTATHKTPVELVNEMVRERATEEYDTKNTIMPVGTPGVFVRKGLALGDVTPDTAAYLRAQATVGHKTQAEVVDALVREKLTMSA